MHIDPVHIWGKIAHACWQCFKTGYWNCADAGPVLNEVRPQAQHADTQADTQFNMQANPAPAATDQLRLPAAVTQRSQEGNVAASALTRSATSAQSVNASTAADVPATIQAIGEPMNGARERVNVGASTSVAAQPPPTARTAFGKRDHRVTRG